VAWPFWATLSFYANYGGPGVPPEVAVQEFNKAEQCNIGFNNAQRRLCAVQKASAAWMDTGDSLLEFLDSVNLLVETPPTSPSA
jgi:hypothetical protein